MFGEYAQIASYLSPRDSSYNKNCLPAYLRPPPHHPVYSWEREKHRLKEDFVMIAEFSELEGPKPVMTIPKDGGGDFDQNTFSVRILATDHQTQTDGFTISEDAQVVLTDYDTGVFAFVHHFVLFDNTARGFVRPYCIAYITADQRKLMDYYEEMSGQMKKVARFFKYGNLLLFERDLERHLKDLDYTKGILLNRVSKMRLRDMDQRDGSAQDTRKNAENELYRALQSIHQSTTEIKDILSILRPLRNDKRLEDRFRLLEERAFHAGSISNLDNLSLQENWFNDSTSNTSLDINFGSLHESRGASSLSLFRQHDYKPILVETKKANRFNASLRGLHELCSWGAKDGLRKLRHFQEYFKRDMVILELEKTESRLFGPSDTGVFCGQCVAGNFLHDVRGLPLCDDDEINSLSFLDRSSLASLDSLASFKSAEDMSLNLYRNGNPSPSSFQTVDSQNCSYEISLADESEYYPQSPIFSSDLLNLRKFTEQSQEDETPSTNSHPPSPSKDDELTPTQNEASEVIPDTCIHHSYQLETAIDDDEPPPLVIFQERIQRPLSVISLGCQEDSEDSEAEENKDEDLKDKKEALNGKENETNDEDVKDKEEALKGQENENKDEDLKDKEEALKGKENENKEEVLKAKEDENEDENLKAKEDYELERTESVPVNMTNKENNLQTQETIEKGKQAKLQGTSNDATSNSHEESSFGDQNKSNSSSANADQSHSQNINLLSLSHNASDVSKNSTQNTCQKCMNGQCLTEKQQTSVGTGDLSSNPSLDADSKRAKFHLAHTSSKNPHARVKPLDPLRSFSSQDSNYSSDLSSLLEEDSSIEASTPVPTKARASSSTLPVSFKTKNIASCSQRGSQRAIKTADRSSIESKEPLSWQIASDEDMGSRTRSSTDTSSEYTVISSKDFFFGECQQAIPYELQSQRSIFEEMSLPSETDNPDGKGTVAAGVWHPHHGLYTLGDWLNNLASRRPGHGLVEVFNSYHNLQHIIFSLMSGRPVLVVGSPVLEQEVIKVVNALAVFVPSTKRNMHNVMEWTSKPLRACDLTKLRLIGVCNPKKKTLDSCIPYAFKRSCSILNVDKRLISAPPYQGQLIHSLLAKRKVFKVDTLYLSHIHWWLMDLMAKAFIFFHSFCVGSAGCNFFSSGLQEHRDEYRKTVTSFMGSLGVRDNDCSIIEHLAELAKLSYIESCQQAEFSDSDNMAQPFQLRHSVCHTYRC